MISFAYKMVGKDEELSHLYLIRAHEIRVFSASWDDLQSVSVGDNMAACRWCSHNAVTSFYLRDLVDVEA